MSNNVPKYSVHTMSYMYTLRNRYSNLMLLLGISLFLIAGCGQSVEYIIDEAAIDSLEFKIDSLEYEIDSLKIVINSLEEIETIYSVDAPAVKTFLFADYLDDAQATWGAFVFVVITNYSDNELNDLEIHFRMFIDDTMFSHTIGYPTDDEISFTWTEEYPYTVKAVIDTSEEVFGYVASRRFSMNEVGFHWNISVRYANETNPNN